MWRTATPGLRRRTGRSGRRRREPPPRWGRDAVGDRITAIETAMSITHRMGKYGNQAKAAKPASDREMTAVHAHTAPRKSPKPANSTTPRR